MLQQGLTAMRGGRRTSLHICVQEDRLALTEKEGAMAVGLCRTSFEHKQVAYTTHLDEVD